MLTHTYETILSYHCSLTANRSRLATLRANSLITKILLLSAPDDMIILSDTTGHIHAYSSITYDLKYKITAHENSIISLAPSEDMKQFITASADGNVKLWDAESGQVVGDVVGDAEAVWWAGWLGHGKVGVVLRSDGEMKFEVGSATS